MTLIRRAIPLTLAATALFPTAALADEGVNTTPSLEAQLAQLYTPRWGNDFAAHAVYVDVAADLGWPQGTIDFNWPFVRAVIDRETGGSFCPNLRGGDRADENCNVTKAGTRSGHYGDSGFMQVNRVHWTTWLCRDFGYCAPADIIATPQDSMRAGLLLIERNGTASWCYDRRSRRSDLCRMAIIRP